MELHPRGQPDDIRVHEHDLTPGHGRPEPVRRIQSRTIAAM